MRNRLFFIFPSAHNLTAMLTLCNLIFITYSLPLLRQLYWFFSFFKKKKKLLIKRNKDQPSCLHFVNISWESVFDNSSTSTWREEVVGRK
jgi:hypothetical protein